MRASARRQPPLREGRCLVGRAEHFPQRPSAGRLLAPQTLLAVAAEDVVDARLLANDLGSRSCLINDVFS
ncbi:MAG: hypothetical protein LC777_02020 [Actinobacteria bacterium]|nr:hypothetical protein [Actinomycetota bacterium]